MTSAGPPAAAAVALIAAEIVCRPGPNLQGGLRDAFRGPRLGRAVVSAPVSAPTDIPEIGVGMLGYACMGKAHSSAFLGVRHVAWRPPLLPRLVAVAGRDEAAVAEAADRYGYERWTTDWRDVVADPAIGLFDNG